MLLRTAMWLQGLSQMWGMLGSLGHRGKHSLAPSGVDSIHPSSDLSPDHRLCVSDWSVNWRHMDALWFDQQWGKGSTEPGGTLPWGDEQFLKGEHGYYNNLERGPLGSILHDSVLSTSASEFHREWNGIPPPILSHFIDPLPKPLTPAGCSSAQVLKRPSGAASPILPRAVSLWSTIGFSPLGPCSPGSG